jgi:membrane-bound ClpP family serine protease
VDLKGPVTADQVSQVQRLIEEQVLQRGANFVCLWIDSPGGSLADSLQLANFLNRPLFGPGKVFTVAYVPVQARSDAALVAMACQQVVMHPRAELGGPGAREFSAEDIRFVREAIRDEKGPFRSRSWSLVAAMIDPQLAVYRYSRLGDTAYFCQEEIDAYEQKHPEAKKWQRGLQVTIPGQQFLVSGSRAKEYGLANLNAESFTDFKKHYNLEHEPALLEPGRADILIEALASPGVAAFLLMVGFVALYVELHSPGIGLGGFIATVCFVLFFWSHYLGGTAGWLEVTLFAAGIACLLLEFFVLPGFGIFGLGGGVLVLTSLVLASQTFVWPRNAYQFTQLQRSLLSIAGAAAGFAVVAALLQKWLPRAPILRQVFLEPPSGEEAETIRRREAMADFQDLLGARGLATTQLTPSGKARFGNRLVDVMTDGDVIARGTQVEVVQVSGTRVIVKAAEPGSA